jgi:hypothetical protein
MADAILAATTSAVFDYAGQRMFIRPGTTVRAGHPMLEGHGDLFAPIVPDYEYVQPVAAPAAPAAPAVPDAPAAPVSRPSSAAAAKVAGGGKPEPKKA